MRIVAHRGYSAAYPENSTLAFERALEAGADFVETDVRMTRDGALVCAHDPDLARLAADARPIAELDLEAIRTIRLTGRTSDNARTLLVLTEVLEIARGRAGVMLDVKVTTPQVVEAIATCLEQSAMTTAVVYGARSVEHVRCVAARAPAIAILGMPARPELAPEFLSEGVRAVRFWEDEVTPERLELVHRAGREVWVTAGLRPRHEAPGYVTAARAAALAARGVDALLVNDPTVGR